MAMMSYAAPGTTNAANTWTAPQTFADYFIVVVDGVPKKLRPIPANGTGEYGMQEEINGVWQTTASRTLTT